MLYREYLNSNYWKNRREEFKSKTWRRCYICRDKKSTFNVHHKRYKREGESILFKEKHTDLRLLCRTCHYKVHTLGYMEILAGNKMRRREIRDRIKNNIKAGEKCLIDLIIKKL